MNKIELGYREQIFNKSDINEHIETIYNFALECKRVTEMGVRWGSSTWAFMYANPDVITSYDILKLNDKRLERVFNVANEYSVNYKFIEADVLKVKIEDTDLLFIDTLHTYTQLFNELTLHSKKVEKYIILHDTETYGYTDEVIYEHSSDLIKQCHTKQGLVLAINDFLETEDGKYWHVYQKFLNNNGLTVLKRNNIK